MKKFVCMVLSVFMIVGLSYSLGFAVADENYYGGKNLYDHHFISGSSSESMVLHEDKNFTREQLAVLILEISDKGAAAAEANLSPNFIDNEEITWSAPYVAYCVQEGLMGGSPVEGSTLNRFNPKGIVTGQQLATVVYGALGYKADWNTVLDDVAELGLSVENKPLTRGEAFNFIWDAITLPVSTEGNALAVTLGKMTEEEVAQARGVAEEGIPGKGNAGDGSQTDISCLDTEDCSFKVAACRVSMDTMTCEVDFEMKNKTLAKNLIFELESVSVNGVTMDNNYFMVPVDAGEEPSTDTLLLLMPSVEPAMKEFTDLQFMVRVTNEDNLDAPIARKTLHVYPEGEQKAKRYQRVQKPSDIVLIDMDEVKISVIGALSVALHDGDVEHYITFVVENKTDDYLSIYQENVLLDGVSINEAVGGGRYLNVYSPIGAKETCFMRMEWVVDAKMENREIENVEFCFGVYRNGEHSDDSRVVQKKILLSPFDKYEYAEELDFWHSY